MSAYLRDLLRLPAGVRRFLTTEALYGIGIGIYSLVLNLHLIAKGMKEEQIGALVSVGILVMGLLAIPVSLLANRVGRKRLLVIGIVFVAAGNMLYAVSGEIAYFYVAQILMSMGFTLVETTEVQLLFHYCASRKEETRAYSLMFAVFTAFTGAGTLIAGYLPSTGGQEDPYQIPLLLAGFILLIQGVIRGLWLPKEREAAVQEREAAVQERDAAVQERDAAVQEKEAARQERDAARQESEAAVKEDIPHHRPAKSAAWRAKLPGRTLWLFAVLMALLGGSFAITGSFLNIIVKYRLDWTDDKVSLLLAVTGFVLFVSSLLTPYIMERFGSNKAIIAIFTLNLVLFSALYWMLPVWLFSILFLVRGGGVTMLSNLVDSQLMSAFKDRDRNLFAGMRAVFRSIGSSGATYLAGWILTGGNYRLPFLLTAAVLGISMMYYWRWVRPKLSPSSHNL